MASSSGNGGGGGGGRIVEVVNGKSCSRMFTDMSSSISFRGIQSFGPADSSFSSQSAVSESVVDVPSNGRPFSGLVICVTGLSKEARQQVMDATEKLGGQYSPHLHHKCTHLVIQSFSGRKFEHALKHGDSNGLFLVTLGWFVESVRRNERLSEKLYSVKNVAENNKTSLQYAGSESPYLPAAMERHAKQSNTTLQFSEKDNSQAAESALSGHTLYIDVDVSPEIRSKILEVTAEEGATVADRWFVGCNASYVVCEGPSMHKYMGYSNIVTPQWVLRTAKEKRMHKLVNLSADLARQIGTMLDNVQLATSRESSLLETVNEVDQDPTTSRIEEHCVDKQKIVNLAKEGVRKRRCRRMQTCQTPLRPITPSILLECICWSVSEPTSTASIYLDTSSVVDNGSEQKVSAVFYGKESEAAFMNHSRPLAESEKTELIFKNHLLSILFPVDRYSEVGPCSRTYFSSTGFTSLQVLDIIYTFYQENMSGQEIETAIHTDSRQADRLRAAYCNNETANKGYVTFKRIDFLGSRKCFEMLKRVSGDNNCNVYELLLRA